MTSVLAALSVAALATATVLSLRLIRVSGRPLPWVLLACALGLAVVRGALTLFGVAPDPGVVAQLFTLGVAGCAAAGIGAIAPVMRAARQVEQEVSQLVESAPGARVLADQGVRRAGGQVEQEVSQLVESAPDAMVLADQDDRIARVNAAAVRLFGWSRHQMEGKDVEMLIPERFRERHRARRARYHEHPRPRLLGASEEVFALHKDGHEFPVEVSVSPLKTAQGDWVVSSVHDLTERRQADEALRESEGRYRTLLDDVLDSSSVAVCILDRERGIVWVNRAFEGHFGLPRSEVVGYDARRLWAERLRFLLENPKVHGDRILATYQEGAGRDVFECRVVPDEGREEAWLEVRSQPITSGLYKGGRIEHYSDVTERRQAEQRIGLFADIARHMQIGLLVYRMDDPSDDRTLRIRALNPEGARLLRVDPEQLLNRTIDEAFPGLRAHDIPRLFADVIRSGEPCDVEEFEYGDTNVLSNVWSFRAFPLPDRCVGVVFESISARKRAEDMVHNIAAGVAGERGEAFFHSLVLGLARSLGMEFAMVGELAGPDRKAIRTIALSTHGDIADNITYDLQGTPCSEVVGHHVCCHTEGVADRFPDDHLLKEMEVECYVGTPLFDAGGDPLGLIAVLGRSRLEDPDTARAVLQIFATRAATEIDRQRQNAAP